MFGQLFSKKNPVEEGVDEPVGVGFTSEQDPSPKVICGVVCPKCNKGELDKINRCPECGTRF